MNRNITIAVIISVLIHTAFFSFLIYYNRQGEEPLGSEFMSVEIIGDGASRGAPLRAPAISGGDGAPPLQTSTGETSTLTPTLSPQGRGGTGLGSPTGNPILTKIRTKIERSKYYPQQARIQRLEGRPEVSFKIAPDGTVGSVQIVRSCGNDLLDSAAIETVNRASPLPFYEDEIRLAIKYSIAN